MKNEEQTEFEIKKIEIIKDEKINNIKTTAKKFLAFSLCLLLLPCGWTLIESAYNKSYDELFLKIATTYVLAVDLKNAAKIAKLSSEVLEEKSTKKVVAGEILRNLAANLFTTVPTVVAMLATYGIIIPDISQIATYATGAVHTLMSMDIYSGNPKYDFLAPHEKSSQSPESSDEELDEEKGKKL